jgi:hypothetical protein
MHYILIAAAMFLLTACAARPAPMADDIANANAAGSICSPEWDGSGSVDWDCTDNAARNIRPLVFADGYDGY